MNDFSKKRNTNRKSEMERDESEWVSEKEKSIIAAAINQAIFNLIKLILVVKIEIKKY